MSWGISKQRIALGESFCAPLLKSLWGTWEPGRVYRRESNRSFNPLFPLTIIQSHECFFFV